MNFVSLALAALGGGVIATLLGSWLEHLRRFESSGLIVLAELMGNQAIALALGDVSTPSARFSFKAWIEHRDRLALRIQRDSYLWLALTSYYTALESQPESQEITDDMANMLVYAIANLAGDWLNPLEAVLVYGLKKREPVTADAPPWTLLASPQDEDRRTGGRFSWYAPGYARDGQTRHGRQA
jgi:hypothetical protein